MVKAGATNGHKTSCVDKDAISISCNIIDINMIIIIQMFFKMCLLEIRLLCKFYFDTNMFTCIAR